MSTKRSPAQSQAQKPVVREKRTSETAAPVHPISAPVDDPNHARPYFEPADMTRTHELIVDAVTTMLTTGGDEDDVKGLIRSAMGHTRRRTFDAIGTTNEKYRRSVAEFIDGHYENWRQDLVTVWRKNRRSPLSGLAPKTITDTIRFNAREALTGAFEEFMGRSSREEQFFMLKVLDTWSSRSHPGEAGMAEIYIASAFEYEIGRDRFHLHVPERMVDQVEKYIAALRAIDDKAAE